MVFMNHVALVGYVGADPTVNAGRNGHEITTFSLAITEKFKNKDGSMIERTDWHKIVCFGYTAKYVSDYIRKGDLVSVEGKLKNNNYTDKNGTKHFETQVHSISGGINLLREGQNGVSKNRAHLQPQNTNQNYQTNNSNQNTPQNTDAYYRGIPQPPQQQYQQGYGNNTYVTRAENSQNQQNYSQNNNYQQQNYQNSRRYR